MDGAVRLAGLLVRSGSLEAIETILEQDGVEDIEPEFERLNYCIEFENAGKALLRVEALLRPHRPHRNHFLSQTMTKNT